MMLNLIMPGQEDFGPDSFLDYCRYYFEQWRARLL
jgi:hypothetical protein